MRPGTEYAGNEFHMTPVQEDEHDQEACMQLQEGPDTQSLKSPATDVQPTDAYPAIVRLSITDMTNNNKRRVYWHHTCTTVLDVMEELDLGDQNNDNRILAGANGEYLCLEMPLKAFCTSTGSLAFIIEEPYKVDVDYRGITDQLRLPSGTTVGEIASMYENREMKPVRVKDKRDLFYGREIRLDEAQEKSKSARHLQFFLEVDPLGCPHGSELKFDNILETH